MRTKCWSRLLGISALVLCLPGLVFSDFVPEKVRIPPEEKCSSRKQDFATLQKRFLNAAKSTSQRMKLEEILKNQKLMTAILAWDVLNTAGAGPLNGLAEKSPKYGSFLSSFLTDLEWMTLYSGAGHVPSQTDVGIRVMADIWARDRRSPDFRKYLSLVTALGSCWGAGPFSQDLLRKENYPSDRPRCDPTWRYFFYKQSQIAGRLQRDFMKLRPWELRFVVGTRWSDQAIAYAQKRVNLHPDQWGWACWAAPYCANSEFGDTIQGPLFYLSNPVDMSEVEQTIVHGGVCGALSHVGSTAALSHGYPSYTCGQPGHCAYAYRYQRGDWRGGFGGPHGGPHDWIFPGSAPAAVDLMEAAFADNRAVDRSVYLLAAARLFETAELNKLAGQAWKTLLREAPLNYNVQMEFQKYAQRNDMMEGKGKYYAYSRTLISSYANHGYALLNILQPIEQEIVNNLTREQRFKWFLGIERTLCKARPSWANKDGGFLDRCWAWFEDDPKYSGRVLAELLQINLNEGNEQSFGSALDWVVKQTVGKGNEQLFSQALTGLTPKNGKKKARSEKEKETLKKVYGKAMIAAEQSRSPEAFHAIADLLHQEDLDKGSDPGRKLKLPSGRLLSAKGLLVLSTSSGRWDSPWAHRKVLTGEDGVFHTDKEDLPNAIVQLPRSEQIRSILIVKNSGNTDRSKHLKVYRSTDGATWFPVAENGNTPDEWLLQFQEPLSARWIKVEQDRGYPEVFHLRNILIFGR